MVINFIAAADLHIRNTNPVFRVDDYQLTIQRKLSFLVRKANQTDSRLLLAGDIFHTPSPGSHSVNNTLDILKRAKYRPICIYGQHDLVGPSHDYHRTALYTLHTAESIILLTEDNPVYDNVVGLGFGMEDTEEYKGDILLLHRCVTPTEPPPYLPDAVEARAVLNQYPGFKFIISGDYHQAFSKTGDTGNTLINCGPMLRTNKDQMDMTPVCWGYTPEKGLTMYPFPHKEASEVFNTEAIRFSNIHGISVTPQTEEGRIRTFENIVWEKYKKYRVPKQNVRRYLDG